MKYHAVIQRDGKWWIGWIEESTGVNSQSSTRRELISNLRSTLQEMLKMNREHGFRRGESAVAGKRLEAREDAFRRLAVQLLVADRADE